MKNLDKKGNYLKILRYILHIQHEIWYQIGVNLQAWYISACFETSQWISIQGPLGSKSNSFSRTNSNLSDDPIIGKDEKLDSNDDDIEEDIDNFLDSQASAGR